MGDITAIFTQYSVGELILFFFLILFAFKAISEILSYFYGKLKTYFGVKNKKEEWENDLVSKIDNIKKELQFVKEQNNKTHEEQKKTDASVALVQERLQENSRSYLIDAHHRFCYEVKAIDDLNLQAMERRYLYYKTAGGNSFIDGLMDEVRALPRINFYTGVIDENHNRIDDREE